VVVRVYVVNKWLLFVLHRYHDLTLRLRLHSKALTHLSLTLLPLKFLFEFLLLGGDSPLDSLASWTVASLVLDLGELLPALRTSIFYLGPLHYARQAKLVPAIQLTTTPLDLGEADLAENGFWERGKVIFLNLVARTCLANLTEFPFLGSLVFIIWVGAEFFSWNSIILTFNFFWFLFIGQSFIVRNLSLR